MYATRVSQPPSDQRSVYAWQTAIAVAVLGTAAAVVLIVLFTYMDDYIGSFWSQVIYFSAILAAVVGLALRSRRNDDRDPSRLRSAASPVSPLGLPGPFVATQALGVLGVAMIAVGLVVQGDRGILWVFGGLVLVLVGAVGLAMWLGTLAGGRRRPGG